WRAADGRAGDILGTHEHHGQAHAEHADKPQSERTDPVCGMSVSATSPHRHEHDGQSFHFCSERCRARFAADPAKYLAPSGESAPAPAGSSYTCPMHPEIRQDHAGICPKCGMALEPELPGLDDDENPELADFR